MLDPIDKMLPWAMFILLRIRHRIGAIEILRRETGDTRTRSKYDDIRNYILQLVLLHMKQSPPGRFDNHDFTISVGQFSTKRGV